ncbi:MULTISPECIES: type I-B CRISPR-associated protein Cas7/Csh2 [unclassified Spirosoma]|uniref:type I-B CRISPR-associated protein Cas7/Csh2 n=1 Tax=unclassified Spirosoma TaxID=2621999 RepID=UPI000960C6A9|nr:MULTISPECIES: type I-B CRISPR-associated protein Cas7/Csh2 [unclassified Spirosoma]MBN8822917.1 type I-B CRISPR-associated protein Cas7/Csh2 [Spirosoma sp.]OJW80103.1 MAG: type I-B CRISPR-associated protein Cas7/Csh2 [Spirosoma sp. 48-14]
MRTIQNRSEILFLYDAKRCNPNGDPLDANRPRIDEESGCCLVTDVRLKRTIRDYLLDHGFDGEAGSKGDIFIRSVGGRAVTGTERAKAYSNREEYLQKFIDVRLFGGVSAPKASPKVGKQVREAFLVEAGIDLESGEPEEPVDAHKLFHFTGPVQFGMGRSLNRVQETFMKGTGAFATKEESIQKTFREEYIITYGLIAFHGVINEQAAKYVGTTDEDIDQLNEAIWYGTKNLLTRSKKGHMPRLLVKIDYKGGFFIGDLIERLQLIPKAGKREDAYSDIDDFIVDTSQLVAVLTKYADRIERISVLQDDRINLSDPILTKP